MRVHMCVFTERFIPAGAGNGTSSGLVSIADNGSSPRARGTDRSDSRGDQGCRFIPAGAGNGRFAVRAEEARAVHPRGRGERSTLAGVVIAIYGSSPRARGTAMMIGTRFH